MEFQAIRKRQPTSPSKKLMSSAFIFFSHLSTSLSTGGCIFIVFSFPLLLIDLAIPIKILDSFSKIFTLQFLHEKPVMEA